MPAKNYTITKKAKVNCETVIEKAKNIQELLNLEFPIANDEIFKLGIVIDKMSTRLTQLESIIREINRKIGD